MWDYARGFSFLVCGFCALGCSNSSGDADGSPRGGSPLASASYAALAVPAIGPEIGTDPPVFRPSYMGHNPELASDGVGFLSVQEVDARIRAVRVDGSGSVLDADWLDFGSEGIEQYYPSVAFGEGHYLVTWSEFSTSGDDSENVVRGRLVATDGSLVGDASFVVSSGQAIYSSVDWHGQHFILAYLSLAGEGVNDVRSVLLNGDGTRVSGSEQTLTTSGSVSNPRLTAGSTSALVVWEEYVHSDTLGDTSTIHGVRVGSDGIPLDSAPIALSTGVHSEQAADVAAGPGGFLVVWQASDPTAVRASIVSDAGTVSASDFAVSNGSDDAGLPSAVFDGTEYVVGWTDARDGASLYGTHVSPSGIVAAEHAKLSVGTPRYVGFSSDHTNLAWNGSHLLLTYLASDPSGIEGSLLDPELAIVESPIALTPIPNSQGYPRTTFNGENYVVAWTDERDSDTDMSLRAVRISATGSVLDTAGIAVSPAGKPALGFELGSTGQGSTLFLWSATDHNPQLRVVRADATLGAIGPLTTQNGAFVPSLASNGNGYLAAFGASNDSEPGSVFGLLLDRDGNLGAEFRIDASTLNTGPFVFPSEGRYLVAYAQSGMRLVAVGETGDVGPSLDLTPSVSYVSAASSGDNSLVTWNEPAGDSWSLHGRFLTAGAFSSEAFELAPLTAGYGSALAWDGEAYWAVWDSPENALVGRSIAADGTLGPTTTLVATEAYAPVLASGAAGQMLLSYAKLAGNRQSTRVVSRLVGRGAGDTGGSGGSSGNAGSPGAGSGAGPGAGTGGVIDTVPASGGSAGTGTGGVSQGGATSTGGTSGRGGTTNGNAGSRADSGGAGGQAGEADDDRPRRREGRCSVSHVGAGERGSGAALLLGLGWAFAAVRRRRELRL